MKITDEMIRKARNAYASEFDEDVFCAESAMKKALEAAEVVRPGDLNQCGDMRSCLNYAGMEADLNAVLDKIDDVESLEQLRAFKKRNYPKGRSTICNNGWMDIESVVEDEKPILVCKFIKSSNKLISDSYLVSSVSYNEDADEWRDAWGDLVEIDFFTHWQPRPRSPAPKINSEMK